MVPPAQDANAPTAPKESGATPQQNSVSPSFISTQIDIVKSDRVAERAVKLLPADQAPVKGLQETARKKALPQSWVARQLPSNSMPSILPLAAFCAPPVPARGS